ncbi:HXXEE domain-containing protein [Nocardiopsis sp. NPDC050513]|uniref:HXXEE domain-containing protein n=1 Tax=Nocardiopsis sp. NPDC050513 TaxID=3364338 RepID=UPI00379535FF
MAHEDTGSGASTRVPASVTWGPLGAWIVHDAEEPVTAPGWSRRARPRLERAPPGAPGRVWDRLDLRPGRVATAVGPRGAVMAAAAADGARTGGRSCLYQATLVGFGLHSAAHAARSLATRGHTPGAVTAPLVVAPSSLWAWRRLRRAGVTARTPVGPALLFLPAALAGVHGLARLVDRRGRRADQA